MVDEPAIAPAPGETHGEDEPRVDKGEEDVGGDACSFPNGSSCNDCHFDAQTNIENEHQKIIESKPPAKELFIAKQPALSVNREAVAYHKECEGTDTNHEDGL